VEILVFTDVFGITVVLLYIVARQARCFTTSFTAATLSLLFYQFLLQPKLLNVQKVCSVELRLFFTYCFLKFIVASILFLSLLLDEDLFLLQDMYLLMPGDMTSHVVVNFLQCLGAWMRVGSKWKLTLRARI
jgi:hypothetical protein